MGWFILLSFVGIGPPLGRVYAEQGSAGAGFCRSRVLPMKIWSKLILYMPKALLCLLKMLE
jgi:hypothetical protein